MRVNFKFLSILFFLSGYVLHVYSYVQTTIVDGDSKHVRTIKQDRHGFLWLGSTDGLFRYDGYQERLVSPITEKEKQLFPDNRILDMDILAGRYLIMRVRRTIFSVYDVDRCCFVDYNGDERKSIEFDDFAIMSDNVFWLISKHGDSRRITISRDGKFAATDFKEVPDNVKEKSKQRRTRKGEEKQYAMNIIEASRENNPTLYKLLPYIRSTFVDSNRNIFLGLENRGVVMIHHPNSIFRYVYGENIEQDFRNEFKFIMQAPTGELVKVPRLDDIVCILNDSHGHKWVGTRTHGVMIDGKECLMSAFPEINSKYGKDFKVSDIIEDLQGRVWISMFSGHVFLATKRTDGKGYDLRLVAKDIEYLRTMMCDHKGQVWICGDGVYVFNPKNLKYQYIDIEHSGMQCKDTYDVYEDSRHRVWVATGMYGVAMADNSHKEIGEWKMYATVNGLADNRTRSIVEDSYGNIWIGTDNGLNVYDSKTGNWSNFFPGSNRLSMMCVENSALRLKDGSLAFGTRHGVIIANTATAMKNIKSSNNSGRKLLITDIIVNGQWSTEMGDSTAERIVPYMKDEIELAYNQNSLTFYVSDFAFDDYGKSSFQFMLEGFDKDWSMLQTDNSYRYANLKPGTYRLHVRAKNANGHIQNEDVYMTITISPAWWNTWWMRCIYILIVIGIVVVAWRIYRNHMKMQEKIRMEEQLTQYKMLFFTNVSHEFRIPLTIIRGCMEEIWGHERMPAALKMPVVNMYKSTKRMLRLIDQLMDFSKIHDNKLKLRVENTEIVSFVREIADTFATMAEQRGMAIEFHTTEKRLEMPLDRNFIDKILYNLIGNAFKYSNNGDTVKVSLRLNGNDMLISIADNGIGIPKEKQEQLFSRFDQSAVISDSIGIGLHLSKTMAEAHHGALTYAENTPKGSIFTLKLSTLDSQYSPDEWMTRYTSIPTDTQVKAVTIPEDYKDMDALPYNDKTILIVEDDTDVLQYIAKTLSKHFRIITASNGEDALKVFTDDIALVITDCVMPVMNGTNLVKNIRGGSTNAHVPVIMLTALTAEAEQVKAFKVGVNMFVQKPFSPNVLLTQVISVIQGEMEKEQTLIETTVGKDVIVEKKPTIIVDAQDKRFRNLFDKWIEEHISDSDLGVEKMAEGLKLGRTILFKRVKEITGKTPNEYIRIKRIEYAQQLLADDSLTIQQVAQKVGIDDSYYFSKVFKSVTGMSPSQYRKTGGKLSNT